LRNYDEAYARTRSWGSQLFTGIGEIFSCPQGIKENILFQRQFLLQKKGLELGKNAGFVYIGQFHHDIPAGLFVFITIKYPLTKVDVF
jgi:hypothetical protein